MIELRWMWKLDDRIYSQILGTLLSVFSTSTSEMELKLEAKRWYKNASEKKSL